MMYEASRAFSWFRNEISIEMDKLDLDSVDVPGLCPKKCSCDTCRTARKAYSPYMEMVAKRRILSALSAWITTESDLHSRWNKARQGCYDVKKLVERWKEYKKQKGFNE